MAHALEEAITADPTNFDLARPLEETMRASKYKDELNEARTPYRLPTGPVMHGVQRKMIHEWLMRGPCALHVS